MRSACGGEGRGRLARTGGGQSIAAGLPVQAKPAAERSEKNALVQPRRGSPSASLCRDEAAHFWAWSSRPPAPARKGAASSAALVGALQHLLGDLIRLIVIVIAVDDGGGTAAARQARVRLLLGIVGFADVVVWVH